MANGNLVRYKGQLVLVVNFDIEFEFDPTPSELASEGPLETTIAQLLGMHDGSYEESLAEKGIFPITFEQSSITFKGVTQLPTLSELAGEE